MLLLKHKKKYKVHYGHVHLLSYSPWPFSSISTHNLCCSFLITRPKTKIRRLFIWTTFPPILSMPKIRRFMTLFGAMDQGLCDELGGKAKMVVRAISIERGERIESVNNASDCVRICYWRTCYNNLCEADNTTPWGDAYIVIMVKTKGASASSERSLEMLQKRCSRDTIQGHGPPFLTAIPVMARSPQ